MFIDLNTLVVGLAFGLILGSAIVVFLIYAAINTPQLNDDRKHISHWMPISKYESQRTFLHASGHEPDGLDW